jgi:hypothetical protein
MAGEGVDERAFNQLRNIRAENCGMTLEAFKQILREQFFGLQLDRAAAMAAIPKMLPADQSQRNQALEAIRRTVEASGKLSGERAKRWLKLKNCLPPVKPKWLLRQKRQPSRRRRPNPRPPRNPKPQPSAHRAKLFERKQRKGTCMERKHEKYERLIARCKLLHPR